MTNCVSPTPHSSPVRKCTRTPVRRAGLSHALTLVAPFLLCAPDAFAQTTTQLWGNFTVNWVKTDRLVYELDIEPKALLAPPEGEPDWRNLDVTPNVEYSVRPWLDLVADTTVGWTLQTDDVQSTELTPRFGVRFHLFSRTQKVRLLEQAPRRRVVVRNLVRVESRNFFYSGGDTDSESTVRFRNRFEFLVPLNRERMTDDGARYLLADWEWFVPLDDATERFANRQRIRTGLGYRRNVQWRYELLYIWTRSRAATDEGFATNEHIINVRVKRVF
jgi:hypothetical protein